ncbi:MAG: MMPL family transporter [Polyangiaceae bacterium]|nr:MMPL family transporter [Polyangiaceae bacterium]
MLILTFVLTAFFGHATATRLRIDTGVAATISDDSDAVRTLDEIRDRFGDDSLFLVLVKGDVYSLPYLERLRSLQDELGRLDMELTGGADNAHATADPPRPLGAVGGDGADSFEELDDAEGWGDESRGSIVQRITSLLNVRQTLWRDGGLVVEGLFDQWPTIGDLSELKKRVRQDRTLLGQVVNAEGTHSILLVSLESMHDKQLGFVYDELVKITDKYQSDDFDIQVAGHSAMRAFFMRGTMRDLGVLGRASALMMLLMLVALFRHPWGVVGPLLVVVQGVVWTFGFMAVTDTQMTLVSNILPAFLFCVGLGDSVHVQSSYRDARRDGVPNHEAIVHAIATTGKPVMFTTLTTALGLLSFSFASLDAVVELGVAGAFGVFATMVHSLVFLPVVLSFNQKSLLGARPKARGRDLLDKGLAVCDSLSNTLVRRNITLVVGGLIGLASIWCAKDIRPTQDGIKNFPPGTAVVKAILDQDRSMGGARVLTLLIDAPEGKTLKDRNLLLALEKLEQHVLDFKEEGSSEPFVTNATSVLDPIRETHRALHGGAESDYRIPDDSRGVHDLFTLFESSSPSQLKRLMTVDARSSLMTFRVRWRGAMGYQPLLDHVAAGIEQHVGGLARVRPGGGMYTGSVILHALLWDLLRSLAIAIVCITLLMVLLLGELRLGLLAMVPNLLPVVMTLGLMGAVGIPLNMGTLLVASVALGIAVDDTIHFLHQFRAHNTKELGRDAAIRLAFQHSGRAMVTTSIILIFGFGVFQTASMSNVGDFGTLVAVTVIFALLVDLIYTPAVLRAFFRSGISASDSASPVTEPGEASAGAAPFGGGLNEA